jgi:hypothetical protein
MIPSKTENNTVAKSVLETRIVLTVGASLPEMLLGLTADVPLE